MFEQGTDVFESKVNQGVNVSRSATSKSQDLMVEAVSLKGNIELHDGILHECTQHGDLRWAMKAEKVDVVLNGVVEEEHLQGD